MSPPDVLARPALSDSWRGLGGALIGLLVGLLVLGLAFHTEVAAAIDVWTSSTAYNHCFLILPITAYLIWDRRSALRGLTVSPLPLAGLATIPLILVWLAADRLGIMEGRQLIAMTFLQALLLGVLGWRVWWTLCGPLLYLYFLVPFGAFLTTRLQDFTTDFVQVGLNVLHIPAYIDGFTIQIPEGSFYVAEACAGLRFLIASIAFGWLYSLLMYRSPVRRGLFLLASLIVPVIANGFRALGIVVLGHVLGSAEAAATDHVLYGWLFFSLVILMLIALGLPFREDQGEAEPPPKPRAPRLLPVPGTQRRALLAAGLVCAFALVGPGVAIGLAQAGTVPNHPIDLSGLGAGCSPRPNGVVVGPPTDFAATVQYLTCDGFPVQVRTVILSRHATSAPVFAAERQMIDGGGEEGVRVATIAPAPGMPRTWRLVTSMNLDFITAVGMWVDGEPIRPSLSQRLHLAWTSIPGAALAPVVMTVTPDLDLSRLNQTERERTATRLEQLLQHWPHVGAEVRRIAAGRG